MADSLEKQVEKLLQQRTSKKNIRQQLETPDNRPKLLYHLNNKSLLFRRRKYMWLNLVLAAMLLFITLKRLLAIAGSGHYDFYLLLDFIVPTINFYILREILLFHRSGYIFLVVLTSLSFVYPENRMVPDLIVNLLMIGLSAFLYLRMFPKDEVIDPGGRK